MPRYSELSITVDYLEVHHSHASRTIFLTIAVTLWCSSLLSFFAFQTHLALFLHYWVYCLVATCSCDRNSPPKVDQSPFVELTFLPFCPQKDAQHTFSLNWPCCIVVIVAHFHLWFVGAVVPSLLIAFCGSLSG